MIGQLSKPERKVPKYMRSSSLFWKATGNALAGLPIALAMNMLVLPPFAEMLASDTATQFLAAVMIAGPFILASILRQWVIDLAWVKWKINISPIHLFSVLYKRIKGNGKN